MAKVVRVPTGAYAPTYSPGSKRRQHLADMAQLAKTKGDDDGSWRETKRKMALGWGVAEADVDLFINDPAAYRAMMDEREKVADEHVRASVEGGAA